MVIRLDIEIWVIGKGGTKKEEQEKGWVGGEELWGLWVLWPLCAFGCISVVVVECACVRDCRGWGCVWLVQ
jgi:hypothetical protein